MYFGQQKIQAEVINTEGQFTQTSTINNENDMNNITYNVDANPVATNGT